LLAGLFLPVPLLMFAVPAFRDLRAPVEADVVSTEDLIAVAGTRDPA
jgi:hypothetical protein